MHVVPAQLLDLASEGIVTCRDGRVVSWNLAAAALYGWQPQEAVGKMIADLLGPYPDEVLERVKLKGEWEGPLRRRSRMGVELDVRTRIARASGDGTSEDWMEVSSAIDVAHPAELALRASEYRYRNLFGAVAASFWELDFSGVGPILKGIANAGITDLAAHLRKNPDVSRAMMRATRIVDTNDRSIEMFGPGSKRDLIAASLEAYWPDESTGAFTESVLDAITGKGRHLAETRMRALDGREFDALFTVSFLPGTVGGGTLLVGFTDISDRVRVTRDLSEASLRQKMFLDVPSIALSEMAAPEMVDLFKRLRAEGVTELGPYIDRHPEIVDYAVSALKFENVNDAAVRLFRANSRADLIGRSLEGILQPRCDVFRKSLEGSYVRDLVFQSELRMNRLDGSPVDTLFCRVSSPDPETGRVLVAQIDISEQVRTRDEVERMRQQVAHSSRISLLGQLSASIVHEISQPITAIANHAAAAERLAQRLSEPADQLVTVTTRIAQQAARVGDIIQRIRSMAADRGNPMTLVSMHEISAETRLLLRQELTENSVRFVQAVAPDQALVRGDRIQLQQVLANLMINAVQAMEDVPVADRELTVSIRFADETVRVEVADTGPGLSDEFEASPFQNFRSTKPDGLGIGLTICRSIAEAHGGTLDARNRSAGPGAVFSLILPAAQPAHP